MKGEQIMTKSGNEKRHIRRAKPSEGGIEGRTQWWRPMAKQWRKKGGKSAVAKPSEGVSIVISQRERSYQWRWRGVAKYQSESVAAK